MAINIIAGSFVTMLTIVTWHASALIFVKLDKRANSTIFAQIGITTRCYLTCWTTESINAFTLKSIDSRCGSIFNCFFELVFHMQYVMHFSSICVIRNITVNGELFLCRSRHDDTDSTMVHLVDSKESLDMVQHHKYVNHPIC